MFYIDIKFKNQHKINIKIISPLYNTLHYVNHYPLIILGSC